MRIEIAGALAAGKSTLTERFVERGLYPIREDLSTNPYLELRKQDPERYDLPCQRAFITDKVESVLAGAAAAPGDIVCDFSFASERAYLDHYLADRPDWIAEIESVIEAGIATCGPADAVVYIRIDPEHQLARIRSRGRGFEQGHDLAFLSAINRRVEDRLAEYMMAGGTVVEIDAIELENDPAAFDRLFDCLRALPEAAREPEAAAL